jgi:hypothetical protein
MVDGEATYCHWAGGIMEDPLDKSFIEQMRNALQKQMSNFDEMKKKEQQDAKIVADEGTKTWLQVKDCVRKYIEAIKDELSDPMLSHSEDASGNQFTLRNELNGRDVQITFNPASAAIAYEGNPG